MTDHQSKYAHAATVPRRYEIGEGLGQICRAFGISLANAVRRAGLPDGIVQSGRKLLSVELLALWEAVALESGDPALPGKVAEMIVTGPFEPALFASLCSPNLYVALERLAVHKALLAPLRLDIGTDGGVLRLSLRRSEGAEPVPPHVALTELAFMVALARHGTRHPVAPLAVTLPAGAEAEAAAFFGNGRRLVSGPGRPVGLVFAREDAERPFLTASDSFWNILQPVLTRRLVDMTGGEAMAERVQAALVELLPAGRGTVEEVAARLAVSRRTLQRRLEQEGDSFQSVLARTRERLARHYLVTTRMSGAEIGFLLGYQDPNSFIRAFHAWTGRSPERARESLH
jgi:AraC-like DNA-binding protein